MAAPTDVRVEAISRSDTMLYWTYAGSATLGVYRKEDGGAYALVTTLSDSETEYQDTDLDIATKYYYKLSDDGGSTYSSEVTVWTHVCTPGAGGIDTSSMPRWQNELPEEQQRKLNEMAERIEAALGRVQNPEECVACPSDGAVAINCAQGCEDWIIVADEDINSISIDWCGEGEGTIEFIIPPNTTGRQICGWPRQMGFTGDECHQAAITSGAAGATISVGYGSSGANPAKTSGKKGTGKQGRGSPRGGSGCGCTPDLYNTLTLKCCRANCSMDCAGTKKLDLRACGGVPPYTWSKSGSLQLSKTTGIQTTVTPPTNTGSTVVGTAYTRNLCRIFQSVSDCDTCGTVNFAGNTGSLHECDDDVTNPDTCQASLTQPVAPCGTLGECSDTGIVCIDTDPETCQYDQGCIPATAAQKCSKIETLGKPRDVRTAPMIAAGCAPCGLTAVGQTVTVTDSIGTAVTITIK